MAAKGRIPLKVGVETNADICRMVDAVREALAGKTPVFVERGGLTRFNASRQHRRGSELLVHHSQPIRVWNTPVLNNLWS